MIEFYRVAKEYQGRRVLRDVTFKTKKGEFLFLTGPSGAGKTTLLKLIFHAEKPTEGQIIVNGMNVSGMPASRVPALRRSMGIVFQDYKLLPARTVLDNLTYVQKFLGKRGQAVVKLDEAQRLVGAAPALGRGNAEKFLHVGHVVENGSRRQELVVLEDDPHRAAESRDA